jgi:putative protease
MASTPLLPHSSSPARPQDVGAVALLRRVAPGLPVHGSTQMSITSPEGANFAASLGVTRVVVGRELSVREIGAVAGGAAEGLEVRRV